MTDSKQFTTSYSGPAGIRSCGLSLLFCLVCTQLLWFGYVIPNAVSHLEKENHKSSVSPSPHKEEAHKLQLRERQSGPPHNSLPYLLVVEAIQDLPKEHTTSEINQKRYVVNSNKNEISSRGEERGRIAADAKHKTRINELGRTEQKTNNDATMASALQTTGSREQSTTKYLIYIADVSYQGAGNIVTGLLGAHLIGLEFNRTVCAALKPTGFYRAFAPVNRRACVDNQRLLPKPSRENTIVLYNFGRPVSECWVQERLSSDEPILYFEGNTYPRWPIVPHHNFFHQYYQPKPVLRHILPWQPYVGPPRVVVHLRQPDTLGMDHRRGLDDDTLHALGRYLPNTTFLVTNRVDWYQTFHTLYGWSHPPWTMVVHSAKPTLKWIDTNDTRYPVALTPQEKDQQLLQLWADWYTILCAEQVYHTASDFSASAVHWNNVWSRIVDGTTPVPGITNDGPPATESTATNMCGMADDSRSQRGNRCRSKSEAANNQRTKCGARTSALAAAVEFR